MARKTYIVMGPNLCWYEVTHKSDIGAVERGEQHLMKVWPKMVPAPVKVPVAGAGVIDPWGASWHANSAEDAYFIRLGRVDLAPGSRLL